jgi:hypothetical protein
MIVSAGTGLEAEVEGQESHRGDRGRGQEEREQQ